MGNKTNELSCLNLAIEQCLKQKGVSKKIGQLLSGEDIDRDSDEAPDFLRYCKPFGNEEKGTVIGIEHFRVDHFSEELKNHKVSSLGYQYERNLKNAVNTWQPKISEDSDIPEGALSTMGELIAQLLAIRIQATYNAFIESFRYSLQKHLRSVERYRSVIKQYAKDKQAELARVLNERRSWFGQVIPEYVETGLYPGNARQNRPQDRVLMEQFMKQEGDDLRQGCLLVIFRIRNNLMHGLKCIEQLNDQLELFKAVNGVLESIKEY